MPNLNKLDAIGDTSERELNELLSLVVDQSMKDIKAKKEPKIQKLYLKVSRNIVFKAINRAVKFGLGKVYVIPSIEAVNQHYGAKVTNGKTLSQRLYYESRRAEATVNATVKQHIKTRTNLRALTVDLNRKVISNAQLPNYIKRVEKAFKAHDERALGVALRKAKRQIDRFTDEKGITRSNLKKAYSDVLKAVEKNDLPGLEKKLTAALEKKSINNSERLARTELSRSYFDGEIRSMQDDDDVVGYRIVLSPSHPRPDQCDAITESDLFGMGIAVFPKTHGIPLPIHIRCICMIEAVLRSEVNGIGRFSKDNMYNYLKGVRDSGEIEKLKAFVGAEGVNRLTHWEEHFKGWEGVQQFTPLPEGLAVLK